MTMRRRTTVSVDKIGAMLEYLHTYYSTKRPLWQPRWLGPVICRIQRVPKAILGTIVVGAGSWYSSIRRI